MKYVKRSQTLSLIEDRERFLEHLIKEYPSLLRNWTEKEDKKFQKEADFFADGDDEIYMSTYSSWLSAFDENEYREDLFYKSMFIMAYAYYESSIKMLAKKVKTKELIDAICKSNNIVLSQESVEAKDFLDTIIRTIRNQLVHNNMSIYRKTEDVVNISKIWSDIHFVNDEITITGSDFILDFLKKELMILKEICEKIGFKHELVQTENSN